MLKVLNREQSDNTLLLLYFSSLTLFPPLLSLPLSFPPCLLSLSPSLFSQPSTSLQHAQTGTGKCRAWIRMAVNECSLESYIGVICQNSSLRESVCIYYYHIGMCMYYCVYFLSLSQHYEVHAFLRDEEVVGPLQQLLGGLSQINFNM